MLRATVSLNPEEGDSPLLSLVEQLPVPTAVFDRQMNYLAVSQPWIEAYGRRHTDLVGKNYYRVHPGIGIAIFPTDGLMSTSLVEQADQALYEAKREGRGAYRFWSTEMMP